MGSSSFVLCCSRSSAPRRRYEIRVVVLKKEENSFIQSIEDISCNLDAALARANSASSIPDVPAKEAETRPVALHSVFPIIVALRPELPPKVATCASFGLTRLPSELVSLIVSEAISSFSVGTADCMANMTLFSYMASMSVMKRRRASGDIWVILGTPVSTMPLNAFAKAKKSCELLSLLHSSSKVTAHAASATAVSTGSVRPIATWTSAVPIGASFSE
mmetsp:Transcript_24901/g.34638  ORF Transcript_24901/g.34638 Transcript_24901/m.34638 type:complete len:219 (+) Transcript_24901:2-658(+)